MPVVEKLSGWSAASEREAAGQGTFAADGHEGDTWTSGWPLLAS